MTISELATTHQAPGVSLEEATIHASGPAETGVPAFIGFCNPKNENRIHFVKKKEDYTRDLEAATMKGSYLKEAITGFFDNGGSYCYIVCAEFRSNGSPLKVLADALISAIESLEASPLHAPDLVAIPDVFTLNQCEEDNNDLIQQTIITIQQKVIEHCSQEGDRMAILDSPDNDDQFVLKWATILKGAARVEDMKNAALYHPWIEVGDYDNKRFVPPCGHITGIISRSDRMRGVFKAPANESVLGAFNLRIFIDDTAQKALNEAGVNCLVAYPGRGIKVWGARTLSGQTDWRYVNVRRMFLSIKRWIDANMQWALFEPNTPRLWMRIQRELDGYLTQLWQEGGLKGAMPSQAFSIRCDASTNSEAKLQPEKVVTEIGLALAAPAEFIVVHITHGPLRAEMV